MKLRILLISLSAIFLISCAHSTPNFSYQIVKPSLDKDDAVKLCVGEEGTPYEMFLVNGEYDCEPEGTNVGLCISNEFLNSLTHYIRELEIRNETVR